MMKRPATLQFAVLPSLPACLLAACQDTLLYGESTAFNLAIHVNDSPQAPIEVNVGPEALRCGNGAARC